jgi:hypothetical protein
MRMDTVSSERVHWPARRWVNLATKAALLALLAHAVLFPDLPQYQGKGIGWRLALYPLSTIVVPIVWWIQRGRPMSSVSTSSTSAWSRPSSSTPRAAEPPRLDHVGRPCM